MDILHLKPPGPDARVPYGPDALQFADLRLPKGKGPHPIAIVIHGGFWRAAYNLEHAGHLSAALAVAGVATWSLEYRRVGDAGGGWPGTCEDVLRGASHLGAVAGKYHLDVSRVVVVGHSAGGHLALWLATRHLLALRGVVSLAGVADLKRAWELRLGDAAVTAFLGGSPEQVPEHYRLASPIEMLPLGMPQRLLHGTRDDVVPLEISQRYVRVAMAVGDEASLNALAGAGHFELIDPRSREWMYVESAVTKLVS